MALPVLRMESVPALRYVAKASAPKRRMVIVPLTPTVLAPVFAITDNAKRPVLKSAALRAKSAAMMVYAPHPTSVRRQRTARVIKTVKMASVPKMSMAAQVLRIV